MLSEFLVPYMGISITSSNSGIISVSTPVRDLKRKRKWDNEKHKGNAKKGVSSIEIDGANCICNIMDNTSQMQTQNPMEYNVLYQLPVTSFPKIRAHPSVV